MNHNKIQTVLSYNTHAQALAEKFDNLGARKKDIADTFALMKKKNPKVLEIGCGNGRDANEIVKYTKVYVGIDISEKLIELARNKVPGVNFEVGDIEGYMFPQELDIIFAFASLIHVPKDSLQRILQQCYRALTSGGIIRLSMKMNDVYKEVIQKDEFGIRTFYFYSREDIERIAQGFIIIPCYDFIDPSGQAWLEIILKKI